MRSNVYRARNEAWQERNRQMEAAGLLSDCFPGVQSIVVTMSYRRGDCSPVLRTLSYYPGNHAFFKISSMGDRDEDGGIDLTYFIHRMVSSRAKSAKGEVSRHAEEPHAVDQSVKYQVAIAYS